jgi:hypothetical protein
MTDAPLTPAEVGVLLESDPNESRPAEAFKVMVLFLVATEVLKVTTVERRVLFMRRGTKPVVSVVREPPAIFLAAEIVDVVRTARGSEEGHDFLSLAQSAYKRLMVGPVALVPGRICPALAARGWLEPTEQNNGSLGSNPPTLYRHTAAGLAEKLRIQSLLDRARQLPALIDTNPAEAKAVLLATGSLLLLVPELKTLYGKLVMLEAGRAPDGGGLAASSECHYASLLRFGSFDLGVLDQGFADFDLYFDASRYN